MSSRGKKTSSEGKKKIKLVKQAKTAQTNTKETQKEPKITVIAQAAKFQQC